MIIVLLINSKDPNKAKYQYLIKKCEEMVSDIRKIKIL